MIREYAPEIHCDGFEIMMCSVWYDMVDKIGEDLLKMNLNFPVFHADKKIGEKLSQNDEGDKEIAFSRFETNCRLAQTIGAKLMVLHLWGGISSDKHIDFNTGCFYELNRIARQYGQLLTIENVVCNQKDPMTHLKMLLAKYPSISFTFDTKMAAFHGQLDEIYKSEHEMFWSGNHIRHLHINDYGGGYMEWGKLNVLHIGKGHVDFDTFFDFIMDKKYAGDFTVEATSLRKDGTVDLENLNKSLDWIRKRIQ